MEKRVDFVIIESNKHKEVLACPDCGCIFDIDAISWLNMTWDKAQKALISVCPDCKASQK